jgi:glycolate oxidase
MLAKTALRKLTDLLGTTNVLHEREDLLTFGYDATPELLLLPDVVVFPTSTEQVVELVKFARNEGLPIVPRGSGTGLSGGSVAAKGGMILCLTRMNRILEIDEENLTATAQAGVVTLDFFDAVAAKGLFYPPDPGSQKI